MGRVIATLSVAIIIAMVALLAIPGLAFALPAETPDNTPMVNGRVNSITQVGTNVWVGGKFSQVTQRNGTLVDNVSNLAVFDSETGQYRDIAPSLGGSTNVVKDMELYGTNVVIAGNFPGPSGSQKKNLVVVDGTSGEVVRWYNADGLQSVLAAPSLGRIYGGGRSLSAFDFATAQKLWSRATTSVNPNLRGHPIAPAYLDLKLDANGQTIWAACQCDAIDGQPAKALAKLNTDGFFFASWRVSSAGGPSWELSQAFGMSLVQTADTLYLGAGGNDFLAAYRKADGFRVWVRDTSGSAQAVEVMDGQLIIGGHFWEVADQLGDQCGNRSSNNAATLDPNDECQTRHGLAAYSFSGTLNPTWSPMVDGKYMLVWALHPDGTRLHFGGEFLTVNGIKQTYYARLS